MFVSVNLILGKITRKFYYSLQRTNIAMLQEINTLQLPILKSPAIKSPNLIQ